MTTDLTSRFNDDFVIDMQNACQKFFTQYDRIIMVQDNMFKVETDDDTEENLLAVADYKLGLLFLYQMRTLVFVHRGSLVTTEVIGSHINTFEIVGDGEGAYKLQRAEVGYVNERVESYSI